MQPEIDNRTDVQQHTIAIRSKPEHYKGIFYVRLSTLPADQNSGIRGSHYRDRIVKIIQDDCLLNDCMIYSDYIEWSSQSQWLGTSPLLEKTST
jgi:hypothetical protein